MATAYEQSKSNNSTIATVAVTFDSNVTAGNVIAVFVAWESDTITASSCEDDLSNSYSAIGNPTDVSSQTMRAALFYAENITGGSCTVTVTLSSAIQSVISVHEISGAATSSSLNASAIQGQDNAGTSTDAVTSGTDTTTEDGCYIFGATAAFNANSTSVGTNFTARDVNTAWYDQRTEDQIQSSAGSIAATFTASNEFEDYITGMMAFEPAGGGAVSGLSATSITIRPNSA